jgi:bifunctional DNA-binding transcriptional regulator/antitoxin component of YhaV-PrlF toxin-antitoxin module
MSFDSAKLCQRGQIILPIDICQKFKLQVGDRIIVMNPISYDDAAKTSVKPSNGQSWHP